MGRNGFPSSGKENVNILCTSLATQYDGFSGRSQMRESRVTKSDEL